jgi:hypothetical protein
VLDRTPAREEPRDPLLGAASQSSPAAKSRTWHPLTADAQRSSSTRSFSSFTLNAAGAVADLRPDPVVLQPGRQRFGQHGALLIFHMFQLWVVIYHLTTICMQFAQISLTLKPIILICKRKPISLFVPGRRKAPENQNVCKRTARTMTGAPEDIPRSPARPSLLRSRPHSTIMAITATLVSPLIRRPIRHHSMEITHVYAHSQVSCL